jgi:hypothetical protein
MPVPGLLSVVITPDPETVGEGASVQFTAIGHFDDSTTVDLTHGFSDPVDYPDVEFWWYTLDPTVATIGNGLVNGGLLFANTLGTTSVMGQWGNPARIAV